MHCYLFAQELRQFPLGREVFFSTAAKRGEKKKIHGTRETLMWLSAKKYSPQNNIYIGKIFRMGKPDAELLVLVFNLIFFFETNTKH